MEPWQSEFVDAAMADGIREAALCVARKNGKSGLIAALLLAHLVADGPFHRPAWRAAVVSLTGRLASELRDAVMGIAIASGLAEDVRLRKTPPPGVLFGADGTKVDIIAADRAGGHAIGIDVGIVDEAGLLEERDRPLWNSLLSATSGRNGRVFAAAEKCG